MALTMKKQAAVPAGNHVGIITRCHETQKTFDPRTGPETVVEVVIQPKWNRDGYETVAVSCVFSHNLSSLSGLGKFLERLGVSLNEGQEFVPASIEGTEVAFETSLKADGFVVVKKESIRRAASK